MAFRPGCPQANTSCTWTLIGEFVDFLPSLEILGLFRVWGPEKCSKVGSNYLIGITWFHFIQGHFLLKIMLRIQWAVIWNSPVTSNFCHNCQESKVPFQLMSYRASYLLCSPKAFRRLFSEGSQVGVFAFQAAQLIFQNILSISEDSPVSH